MLFKDAWTEDEKVEYATAYIRFADRPLSEQVSELLWHLHAETYEGSEREEPACAAFLDHIEKAIRDTVEIIKTADFVTALRDGTHPSEDWRVAAQQEGSK